MGDLRGERRWPRAHSADPHSYLSTAIGNNPGAPVEAQQVKNLTNAHGDVGWIPGLTYWVKDPVLSQGAAIKKKKKKANKQKTPITQRGPPLLCMVSPLLASASGFPGPGCDPVSGPPHTPPTPPDRSRVPMTDPESLSREHSSQLPGTPASTSVSPGSGAGPPSGDQA